MIKVKKGKAKAKGTINEVLTDLAHASDNVVGFLEETGLPREEAVKVVKEVVEVGCMTNEERREKAEEQFGKLMHAIHVAFAPEEPCNEEKEGEQAEKNGEE